MLLTDIALWSVGLLVGSLFAGESILRLRNFINSRRIAVYSKSVIPEAFPEDAPPDLLDRNALLTIPRAFQLSAG